jgi:hypothetical protein
MKLYTLKEWPDPIPDMGCYPLKRQQCIENFLFEILLCFFHFSHSGLRRVQYHGLVREWYDDKFRISFKTMQALA